MDLNHLLATGNIDPRHVIVLRHRPYEKSLSRVFPWLIEEREDLFNAYQRIQGGGLASSMKGMSNGFLASFVGLEPGEAVFVGLYSIGKSRELTHPQFWEVPENIELKSFGMTGPIPFESTIPSFELRLQEFRSDWRGKLIVGWPPPGLAWWRRAHKNTFPIKAILEESALSAPIRDWTELNLSWAEIQAIPKRLRTALAHWRGIYYIYDVSDGKGYVGSAYGADNILGRWIGYAARGHGGNKLLRGRHAENFRFSILQLVSPDMDAAELIRLENTWKERLHTRHPRGLNNN